MTIHVGIATYSAFHLCERAIITAFDAGADFVVVLDDSNGKGYEALRCTVRKYDTKCVYIPVQQQGWAGAQNWFLKYLCDDLIIANDDVEFGKDTLSTLVNASHTSTDDDALMFYTHATADSPPASPWSCYLLKQKAAEVVGYFDTLFFPTYYDDNDYYRRMDLLGKKTVLVPGGEYKHVGSATINISQEALHKHHPNFRRLGEIYRQKWGGDPGNEVYTAPWNNAQQETIQQKLQYINSRGW